MDTEEKSIFVLVVIAAAILGVILVFFVITIIRQQRKTAKLHLDQVQAEIRALERERNRIATDLHDDLGPVLSAARFKVNAMETASEADELLVASINQHLDDSLKRIREIAFNLMPATLIRKGIVVTFEEFLSKTEQHLPFRVRFQHTEVEILDQEITVNLYRIMLEILHNTIKHADATELFYEIRVNQGILCFHSQDNGVGFNPDQPGTTDGGLGLKNLQSRVSVMGGELRLQTTPGKGVHCYFEIPLKRS
jgi:signal transduction histidine kinase